LRIACYRFYHTYLVSNCSALSLFATMMAAMSQMKDGQKEQAPTPTPVLVAYGLFALSGFFVWHLVADGAFSSILTLSVMVQCLAMALLGFQIATTGSAHGISAKALTLDGLALCCRLSSTLWLNGYLPVDASGDYIFQLIDVGTVGIVAYLLHQVLVEKKHTYQAEEDSLPIMPMIVGSFVLAALFHGNMNGRPLFDTLWMAGLLLGTVAVLPQLWLVTHSGGRIEALTSHHIAAMAASRALSGIFMWHARGDITCTAWMFGLNHVIWVILGSHLLHLILLGDFAYYYIKAIMVSGLNCRIEIMEACGV